jgi:hypothetical protein
VTRRAAGRRFRGASGHGAAGSVTRCLAVGTVAIWLVARAFSPEATDRVAGDIANGAGTVAARAITGVADTLLAWFTDTMTQPIDGPHQPSGSGADRDPKDRPGDRSGNRSRE